VARIGQDGGDLGMSPVRLHDREPKAGSLPCPSKSRVNGSQATER
jgi:hypothetical protein